MHITASTAELLLVLRKARSLNAEHVAFLTDGNVFFLYKDRFVTVMKTTMQIYQDVVLTHHMIGRVIDSVHLSRKAYNELSEEQLLPLYTGDVVTVMRDKVFFDWEETLSTKCSLQSVKVEGELVKLLHKEKNRLARLKQAGQSFELTEYNFDNLLRVHAQEKKKNEGMESFDKIELHRSFEDAQVYTQNGIYITTLKDVSWVSDTAIIKCDMKMFRDLYTWKFLLKLKHLTFYLSPNLVLVECEEEYKEGFDLQFKKVYHQNDNNIELLL